MDATRRSVAFAGAIALAASYPLDRGPMPAESDDETALNHAVDSLRKALLDGDKARLQQITADQLN